MENNVVDVAVLMAEMQQDLTHGHVLAVLAEIDRDQKENQRH